MKYSYKEGDVVAIIHPKRFIRVGYPMEFETEYENIYRRFNSYTLNEFNAIDSIRESTGVDLNYFEAQKAKIVRELTYASLKIKGFGGNKREIYEEDLGDEYIEAKARVNRKDRIVTGERVIEEYGPELVDQEHHTILTVEMMRYEFHYTGIGGRFAIRADYVAPWEEYNKAMDKFNWEPIDE